MADDKQAFSEWRSTIGDVVATVDESFVATVEIQRGPNNFLSLDTVAALGDAFEALDDHNDHNGCRVLVLCSEGKHFCAGGDFTGTRTDESNSLSRPDRHLYEEAVRLFGTRKPIVAAVQGAAIGGGLGLAMAADFRIGSPEARFSANFARLGFHHGFGLSATLPPVIGQQRSLELLMTGRRIKGNEAAQIGLCDRLVEASVLRQEALAFAVEIALSAPLAVESIRQMLRGDIVQRVLAATARERSEQEVHRKTSDWIEGVGADKERRLPRFLGR